MKILINKLKEKPKIYKCLKILGIVGICLSLIFNAVIIGSAIALKVRESNNNKSIQNLVTTPIKGALDYGGEEFYESAMHLTSSLQVWKDLSVLYFGQENNFTKGYLRNVFGNVTLTRSGSSNIDFSYCINMASALDTPDSEPSDLTTIYPISQLVFYVSHSNDNTSLEDYVYYEVTLKLDRPSVPDLYNYRRYIYRDYYSTNALVGTFLPSQFYTLSSGNTPTNVSSFDCFLEAIVYTKGSTFYQVWDTGEKDYWDGYYKGYDYGYQSGKRDGDAEGYHRGLENAPSNVFDYLAQAFNSVASILNINILPNLSLGVLVFTPVIVSIIIVVVKMIKG